MIREGGAATMGQAILSVDIGGTKVLAALVSPQGEVIDRVIERTASLDGFDAVVEQLSKLARLLAERHRGHAAPDAIALAVAGAIDVTRGVVTTSPNLPEWKEVPLRGIVSSRLGLPAYLINDASAAALGEHRHGAGVGTNHMVFMTVSTGIGGGIVIDGKLYQGASGAAGEIGHMVIEVGGPLCGCGNSGCLEALASGTAIARDASERIALGTFSSIPKFTRDGATITAEAVAMAAKQGDPLANEVISRAAQYLGAGLANVVNIFNPEMVVVGGGVAQMGEMLLGPARVVVQEKAFALSARAAKIVRARLGGDAGIVGAAVYAAEEMKGNKS
ncbi:MAG: ROK family protein [Chloroflexi bacterium]|nr:ROK family protein [Chloroflexota bacterium]